MVKVNNIDVEVLENDTEEVFKINVANALNTLPRFLNFKEPINLDDLRKNKKKKIEVIDLISFSKSFSDNIDFEEYYDLIKENNFSIDDVVKLWIVNHQNLGNSMYRLLASSKLEELFGKRLDIDRILNEKDEYLNKLNIEKAQIRKKAESQNKILKKINTTKGKYYSDFETEKITLQLVTDIKDLSLFQVFDNIRTNHFIPMANYRQYYKIFEEFKPLDSFLFTSETDDIIFLKFLSTKTHSSKINLEKDYEDSIIYYKDGKLVIDVKTNLKFLTEDELISRILSLFPSLNMSIVQTEKYKFNGVYFIPDMRINKFVLSDMVMNNPLFENFLVINENVKAAKKKSGVYLYFTDPLRPDLGEIRANVIMKVVKPSDYELRSKDRKYFPFDTPVLRVKVSYATNMKAVEHFQQIFSKLMTIYETEKNSVINFYKEFVPDFGKDDVEVIKDKEKKKLDLKYLAPDLFVAEYATLCQVEKPTIIPDSEVKNYSSDKVMKFPKTPQEGNQYNYVCNYKTKPYPGLILNTLPNRDVYPYLPCCFKKDQNLKDKSYYKAYFYDQEIEEGEQQRIITTNKLSQKDKFGVMPTNLKLIFETFDSDFCSHPEFCYLRKGVTKGKSSFLECVLDALKIKMDNRLEFVKKERTLLARMNLALCKQECFDLTIPEIENYILNLDNYLDPKMFIRLLEEKYNVNIFLFTRDFGSDDAYMILPRHIQGHFYTPKNKKRSILIYEHLGNESDRSTYPQCETLVQWDGKSEANFFNIYNTDSPLIKGVKKMYSILNGEYYILDKQNKQIDLQIPKVMIQNQYIDQYGKCRILSLKVGKDTVNMFTSPLPPFDVMMQDVNYFLSESSYENIEKIVNDFNIILDKQKSVGNRTIVVGGFVNNVEVSFKIKGVKKLDYPEYTFNLPLGNEGDSALISFEKNRQIANILSQEFLHLYSKYVIENNLELGTTSIVEFVNKNVITNNDWIYQGLDNNFGNKGIFSGRKIVVPDEESVKRLVYITRLWIERYRKDVETYYNLKFIPNFYQTVSDFKRYPLEILLNSKERVLEYINTSPFDNKIHMKIDIQKNTPYFILLDRLYLIVPTTSLDESRFVGKIWSEKGYNPKDRKELDEDLEIEVWLYKSIEEIKKVIKGSIDNDYSLKVLVYKKDGEVRWNCLLEL